MLPLMFACAEVGTELAPPCASCFSEGSRSGFEGPTQAAEDLLLRARPELGQAFQGCVDCSARATWYDAGDSHPDRWRVFIRGRDRAPLWLEVDRARETVTDLTQPWDPEEPASVGAANPIARAAALTRNDDVDTLASAVADPAWIVRERALSELTRHLDDPRAVGALARFLIGDSSSVMDRWLRTGAKAMIPGGLGAVALGDAVCDPEPAIRLLAVARLAPHRDPAWVEPWLNDPDRAVAMIAERFRFRRTEPAVPTFDGIYTPQTSPTHPILAHMPTCRPEGLTYRLVVWSPAVARPGLTATFESSAGPLAPLAVPVEADGVAILDVPVEAETRMRSVALRVAGAEVSFPISALGAARVVGLCDGAMPGVSGEEPVAAEAWAALEWAQSTQCRDAARAALPSLPMRLAERLAGDPDLPDDLLAPLIDTRSPEARVTLLEARLRAGPDDDRCADVIERLGPALDPNGIAKCRNAGPRTSAALARSGADAAALLPLVDAGDRPPLEAALARRALTGDRAALRALKLDRPRKRGPVWFPVPADAITGFFDDARCDTGPAMAQVVDQVLVLPRSDAQRLPLHDIQPGEISIALCGGAVRWQASR